jgi:hypothetical protein
MVRCSERRRISSTEKSTSNRGFGDVDTVDGRSRCCTGAPAVLSREGERTSYAPFKSDGGSSDLLWILFSFALDFFPLHSVAHSILPRSVPRIVAASYPLFFWVSVLLENQMNSRTLFCAPASSPCCRRRCHCEALEVRALEV